MSNKREISAEALEKEIIEFLTERATKSGGKRNGPGCNLNHGYACVLATSHENIPRATPVDFFCDGTMTLWINGEPGGKIANIMRNPKVAVGFYEKVNHAIEQKSMQLWGNAELINKKNNGDIVDEKFIEFGLDEAMAGMLDKMILNNVLPESAREKTMEMIKKKINLIKIIPEKIVLLQMNPDGPPARKIWENGKAVIDEGSS